MAVFAAPVRGAQRPDRRHDEAGDRVDRGQAVRRAQRRGLAGHADRPVRLPLRRPRHSRRLDDRAAVRQELSIAGDRADRRRAAGGRRNHAGAQAARDPDGADARQDVLQGRDPDPLPELVVVRQRRLRRAGRRADLLRHRRLAAELAAGRAVGRHGAVDELAEPVHQPRGCPAAAKRGAGHHDREPAAASRRAARRQGCTARRPAAAQRAAGWLHRRRRSRVLLRLRAGLPRAGGHQQGAGCPRRLSDPHDAGPEGAGFGQAGDRQGRQPDAWTASPA